MSAGAVIAVVRLVHDAWRNRSDVDFRFLQDLLDETEPEELRGMVEDLAVLVVGLATIIDDTDPTWRFDDWLAVHGLRSAQEAAA